MDQPLENDDKKNLEKKFQDVFKKGTRLIPGSPVIGSNFVCKYFQAN